MKKNALSLLLLIFILSLVMPAFAINDRLIADSNRYPMDTFVFYYSRNQPYFYLDPHIETELNFEYIHFQKIIEYFDADYSGNYDLSIKNDQNDEFRNQLLLQKGPVTVGLTDTIGEYLNIKYTFTVGGEYKISLRIKLNGTLFMSSFKIDRWEDERPSQGGNLFYCVVFEIDGELTQAQFDTDFEWSETYPL
ncbi:MAG: hypothetical protein ACW963_04850 [Candidatus Sifarchaeia archaeon]|jgi:hypothetical protein